MRFRDLAILSFPGRFITGRFIPERLRFQSSPIQSNLFKSGNKAHTVTHYTIYTVEIKPKIKPREPNKTHI